MKILPCILLAGALCAADPKVIPLYPGAAPGSENWTWQEENVPVKPGEFARIRNVSRPTLTVYQPDPGKANGTAMIVCPGGGWRILAIEHEGYDVARWLNSQGVTVFILKYRVMRTGDEGEKDKATAAARRTEAMKMGHADGLAAMRLVRSRASEWGVAPNRIGIMGFSAGGYVAAMVAMQYDPESRPDFAAPIYAFIPETISAPANAPPLFLVHADDDKLLPPIKHSLRVYEAWKSVGVSAEMHIYAAGGHGFGMRKKNLPVDTWIDRLGDWLGAQGLLKR